MKTCPRIFALLLFVTAATFGDISAAALKVGDPAPKLQVSNWAQGEPIKEFERDKAYIVEFWATWCGPCVVSIPHLNEVHNKFKDKGLIVIGQDVWEQKPEAVAPFIKKMGDKMTYRVALDLVTGDDKGAMAQTWMEAAGQNGIPAAFVIDKRGLIAWIGHPMNLKEKLLEEVLAGSFDIRKAAADYEQRQKAEQQMSTLWGEFRSQSRAKEWDRAESTLAQVEKLMPEDERDNLATTRFGLLLKRGDYTGAYKLAARFSEAHADDAMRQNALAWQIATDEGIERRDLDLAEKIARRANAATKGENAEILDTLARVLFMKGQKEAAVELQEKAVARTDGGRQTQFRKILDSYKAGKMPDDVRINALRHELSESLEKKKWDNAERVLGELEKLLPQDAAGELGSKRFRILAGRKDYKGAEELAIRLSEARKDGGTMALNQLAWEVAISKDVPEQEVALAERIARRANDGSNGSNAEVLDTLARLLFLKGDAAGAIEFQEKAAKFAKGNRQTQFQATLDSYKEGKLPAPY
jgi:thiol-disulfide isomerase/thioredoxin